MAGDVKKFNWKVDSDSTNESGDRYNVLGYSYRLVESGTSETIRGLAGFSEDESITIFDRDIAGKRYDLEVFARTFPGTTGNWSTNWALESFDIKLDFNTNLFSNWSFGSGKDKPEEFAQTFTQSSDASNGSVHINSDGTWIYTPNANFIGDDSFDVTVSNSFGSSTRTVNVSINSDPNKSIDSGNLSNAYIEWDSSVSTAKIQTWETQSSEYTNLFNIKEQKKAVLEQAKLDDENGSNSDTQAAVQLAQEDFNEAFTNLTNLSDSVSFSGAFMDALADRESTIDLNTPSPKLIATLKNLDINEDYLNNNQNFTIIRPNITNDIDNTIVANYQDTDEIKWRVGEKITLEEFNDLYSNHGVIGSDGQKELTSEDFIFDDTLQSNVYTMTQETIQWGGDGIKDNAWIASLRELNFESPDSQSLDHSSNIYIHEAKSTLTEQGLVLGTKRTVGQHKFNGNENNYGTNLLRKGSIVDASSFWVNQGSIGADLTSLDLEVYANEYLSLVSLGKDGSGKDYYHNNLLTIERELNNTGQYETIYEEQSSASGGEIQADAIEFAGSSTFKFDIQVKIAEGLEAGSRLGDITQSFFRIVGDDIDNQSVINSNYHGVPNNLSTNNLITYQSDINYDGIVNMQDLAYLNAGAKKYNDAFDDADANGNKLIDTDLGETLEVDIRDVNVDNQNGIDMDDLQAMSDEWNKSLFDDHALKNPNTSLINSFKEFTLAEIDNVDSSLADHKNIIWENDSFETAWNLSENDVFQTSSFSGADLFDQV